MGKKKRRKQIQRLYRLLAEGQTKTERRNAREFFRKMFRMKPRELRL